MGPVMPVDLVRSEFHRTTGHPISNRSSRKDAILPTEVGGTLVGAHLTTSTVRDKQSMVWMPCERANWRARWVRACRKD